VQFKVKNTGRVAGQEIAQVYVREDAPGVSRPEKELKAFAKVALEPGEEKTVRFELSRRDFAYYDASRHTWAVQSGRFEILVGSSSRELPLKQSVQVQAAERSVPELTRGSLVKDFLQHPKGKAFYPRLAAVITGGEKKKPVTPRTPEEEIAQKKAEMSTLAFVNDMPVYKLVNFSEGRFSEQMLNTILDQSR
jgi:beta-glucosidase